MDSQMEALPPGAEPAAPSGASARAQPVIAIRGASEHNLRQVSVDIPKRRLVSFTGVSGSGKSSLVFDTIYVEAFRRFADASQAPVYVMGGSYWQKTARPKFLSIRGLPPALGLSQRQGVAGKLSTVGTISGMSDLLRVYFAAFGEVYCRNCDIPLRATSLEQLFHTLTKDFPDQTVTVVAPIVEKRKGGFANEIEKFRLLGFSRLRVNGTLHNLQDDEAVIKVDAKKLNTIELLVDKIKITADKHKRLERALVQALEYGKGVVGIETDDLRQRYNNKSSCPQCGESAPRLDPRHFSHSSLGQCPACDGTGASVEGAPEDLLACPACDGVRLSNARPIVRVLGRTFEELHLEPLHRLAPWVRESLDPASKGDKARGKVSEELRRLVDTIERLGLDHLNLNRSGASLAPGDLQRLRLSSMISNRLQGALYVLDEPCQGLTAIEVDALVALLRELVTRGASVIAVEHHPRFLATCDVIFHLGPGAGSHGGQLTGVTTGREYARDLEVHTVPKGKLDEHAGASGFRYPRVEVRGIKREDLFLPAAGVSVIRGRAGGGKASFLDLCVYRPLELMAKRKNEENEDDFGLPPALLKKICQPVAVGDVKVEFVTYVRPGSVTRASRRTVASALDVVQPLRELFAKLPQSQVLGLTESHFSPHSKLGRCPTCEGKGFKEIPQRFGPPVEVMCDLCLGARLGSKSLLPRFKGRNYAELMEMSLEENHTMFQHVRLIETRLGRALQFGLGYLKLGQGMDSLSGGELQRLMLTIELKRANLAGAWFLLAHPGTGLHKPDIKILGELMRIMKERGASFVLLENREEFLPFADHVIEF